MLYTVPHHSCESEHWCKLSSSWWLGLLWGPLVGSASSASVMSAIACTFSSALTKLCALVSFRLMHGNADSTPNSLSRHSAPLSSVSEHLPSGAAERHFAHDTQWKGQAVTALPSLLHQVWYVSIALKNAARKAADIVLQACTHRMMSAFVVKAKFRFFRNLGSKTRAADKTRTTLHTSLLDPPLINAQARRKKMPEIEPKLRTNTNARNPVRRSAPAGELAVQHLIYWMCFRWGAGYACTRARYFCVGFPRRCPDCYI